MMLVSNDQSHQFNHDADDMSGSNDVDGNESHHPPGMADGRTIAWAYQPEVLPSEDFAADYWPPSVYEAAQHLYPTSRPFRQPYRAPVSTHLMPVEEPWQPSHASLSSFQNRTQNIELLQGEEVNGTYFKNPFATSYLDFESSSTDVMTPSASENANDVECVNSNTATKPSLRCPVCVDKPPFTGQYAQRNLNRHMERHDPCITSGSHRNIRCEQPGCTSTFGREDALLVHLRRSHPELDTPPAKKRRR